MGQKLSFEKDPKWMPSLFSFDRLVLESLPIFEIIIIFSKVEIIF
jgi:hypothetical protein